MTKRASKGLVIWLTGLSGAGKTTLAVRLAEWLAARGLPVERLDGDILRGHFPDTGFTRHERDEHIRRVGFMASLLEKHGVAVVCSFISPYRQARQEVRDMCRRFVEVYVRASVEVCEARDVKGLYARARAGQIANFTGLDDPYEPPDDPELIVDTDRQDVDESLARITASLERLL
jgi:adenylylsulfate kinase